MGRGLGVRLPARVGFGDVALLGVATHKASRLLTKDAVTSPLRVPFARFEEETGMGEVNESIRGHGANGGFSDADPSALPGPIPNGEYGRTRSTPKHSDGTRTRYCPG